MMTRPKLKPRESDIQASIVAALRIRGWMVQRVNCLAANIDGRHVSANHVYGFGSSGIADLLVMKAGRGVYLEIKTGRGKPTPAQVAFRDWCALHGNRCVTCRTVEDALRAVEIGGKNEDDTDA